MFGFLCSGKLQAQHKKDAEEIARLRNQLATVESQNSSLQSDIETLRATLSARDEKCDWLSNIFDRVAGVQELLGSLQSSSYNLSVTMRNESALFQESSMTAGLGGEATIKFVDGVRHCDCHKHAATGRAGRQYRRDSWRHQGDCRPDESSGAERRY
jgi:hypothetical protein